MFSIRSELDIAVDLAVSAQVRFVLNELVDAGDFLAFGWVCHGGKKKPAIAGAVEVVNDRCSFCAPWVAMLLFTAAFVHAPCDWRTRTWGNKRDVIWVPTWRAHGYNR